MSKVKAFSKDSFEIISEILMFLFTSSTIISPLSVASLLLSEKTAGIVPFPGRDIPKASVIQFMEFAVNMPAHEPYPGQADFSNSSNSSKEILLAFINPTASNISCKSIFLPW